MLEVVQAVVEEYLEHARVHALVGHTRAEGYWIGRAVQYGHQYGVEEEWFDRALSERGLDVTIESWNGEPPPLI